VENDTIASIGRSVADLMVVNSEKVRCFSEMQNDAGVVLAARGNLQNGVSPAALTLVWPFPAADFYFGNSVGGPLQSSVICMLPRWCLKVAARFEKL
jgi:hypothetical protein